MYQKKSIEIKKTAIVLNEIGRMYHDGLLYENNLIEAGNFYKKRKCQQEVCTGTT